MKAVQSKVRSFVSQTPPEKSKGTKTRRTQHAEHRNGKASQKLPQRDIKVSEAKERKSAESKPDAQLRKAITALGSGDSKSAREAIKVASRSLHATAKTKPDEPDFVRAFCSAVLTPDLARLEDQMLVNMERHWDALKTPASGDAVFAQTNFSLKVELLTRVMRVMADSGIDPEHNDLEALNVSPESVLVRYENLVGEVVGLAKDEPLLQAELAAKDLPLTTLRRIHAQAIKSCNAFSTQKSDAIALVNSNSSTSIADMPPAELKKWAYAVDVLQRSDPGRHTADFPGKDAIRLLGEEVAAAEKIIIEKLISGDIKQFKASELNDQVLAKLQTEMTLLEYVPKALQDAFNQTNIENSRRVLQRVDPEYLRAASVSEVETLIAHVGVLLPVASSPDDFSILQLISEGLMRAAVERSASATVLAASVTTRVHASATAVATAAKKLADLDTAAGQTKPKSKARAKADAAADDASRAMNVASANAQRVAVREANAWQAAASAKKVAADAANVLDRVTAALAKAQRQKRTSKTH